MPHLSLFSIKISVSERREDMEVRKVLTQTFWLYESFSPGQKEIIEQLLDRTRCVALLPTGMGKSLCYQLPGYIFNKPVLIISPLLSLMQDQVDQMKQFGEKRVVALNSFLTHEQKQYALQFLHNIDLFLHHQKCYCKNR